MDSSDDDDDQYNFGYRKRGLAIIINNYEFQVPDGDPVDERLGSKEDEIRLKKSFSSLEFEVIVRENLKGNEMLSVLQHYANKDIYNHSDADCFACAIFSHGDRQEINDKLYDVVYGIDYSVIKIETILGAFNSKNCPGLAGKPRLFFFQTCRGNKFDSGINIRVEDKKPEGLNLVRTLGNVSINDTGTVAEGAVGGEGAARLDYVDSGGEGQARLDFVDAGGEGAARLDYVDAGGDEQAAEEPKVAPVPLYKDCLVMYAAPPGYYAWRRANGSWFIIELCSMLDSKIVYRKSFATCLMRVCSKVASYKSNTADKCVPILATDTPAQKKEKEERNEKIKRSHGKVSMPVVESMLLKEIIFTRKSTETPMELE